MSVTQNNIINKSTLQILQRLEKDTKKEKAIKVKD